MLRAPQKERAFPWAAMLLLCLIIVVSTADRQIIALIKPVLDKTFGWSAQDYARISFWTQVASACSLLVSGWLVDRLGSRRVLGVALAGWSLMTILHAVITSVREFVLVRATLGALEGAGMPSLMKLIATGVPRAERARVIGLVNAVPNVAAVITPVLVGLLLPVIGWKVMVVVLGLTGVVLAGFWWRDQAGPWGLRLPMSRMNRRKKWWKKHPPVQPALHTLACGVLPSCFRCAKCCRMQHGGFCCIGYPISCTRIWG